MPPSGRRLSDPRATPHALSQVPLGERVALGDSREDLEVSFEVLSHKFIGVQELNMDGRRRSREILTPEIVPTV
jgi:hypothetical protein